MIDVPTIFDTLETRCPQLGGTVSFLYCRKLAEGLPCRKSLICWEAPFPVREYMVRILSEDEWRKTFEEPPKGRLDRILEAAGRVGEADVDNQDWCV